MSTPDTTEHPELSDEQIHFIADTTERAVKKGVRAYVRRALVGFLILLLGGIGFGIAQIQEINARSERACERLNIVRAQSNVSDSVSFYILSGSAIREEALAKQAVIKGNGTAKIHADSARILFKQADRLTVTDLTNCDQAQDPSYNYPLAGPIGNAHTGHIAPREQAILNKSERLVFRARHGAKS